MECKLKQLATRQPANHRAVVGVTRLKGLFAGTFSALQVAPKRIGHSSLPAWPLVHCVAVAALVLRLMLAWRSDKISYPDVLFQYLEQAHRLVYGYGIIPWEYRFGTRN